jgi:hypothetical protein
MEILFIDDDNEEFTRLQGLIDRDDSKIKPILNRIPPSESLTGTPDVILVDYQLTNPEGIRKASNVSGLDIGASLRADHPKIPIILFSYKDRTKLASVQKSIGNQVFDEMLYKDDFAGSDKSLVDFLSTLCKGYSEISRVIFPDGKFVKEEDNKEKLYKILAAPSEAHDDIDSLLRWNEPFFTDDWTPFGLASMIRKELMDYPGILYDSIHAATFLGISEKAFKKIESFFNAAKYQGVFSEERNFWWKCTLKEIADSIMKGDELKVPYSHGFFRAWKRKEGVDLELAECCVSKQKPAECVCCILNKPVIIRYTLPYPDITPRPPIMDESRASFKAFLDNRAKVIFLDKDSKNIFDKYLEDLRSHAS